MLTFWTIAGTVFFMWLMFPALRPWNWIPKKEPEDIWAVKPTYKIVYFGPAPKFHKYGIYTDFKGYVGKDGWHDWVRVIRQDGDYCGGQLGDLITRESEEEILEYFAGSKLMQEMPYLKYRVEMHTPGKLKSAVKEEKRQAEHEALQNYNERYTKFLETELANMKEL